MPPISNTVWTVLGVVATVAVGAAVASSSSSAAAAAPPTIHQPNFPVQAGHRYSVTVTSTQPIGATLAVTEVLNAFPGAVDVDTLTAPPQGATMNVLTAGNPTPSTCNYVFDLFVSPTNPPGQFTAAQLAAPYAARAPSGASLTVAIADQGATPPYGQPGASSWTRATIIHPGDRVRTASDPGDFATIAGVAGVPVTAAGWQQFFGSSLVSSVLAPTGLSVYGPGDTLPSDWPADDPSPSTEYHAQFTYGGSVPLSVSLSPLVGATVWTMPAGGATYTIPTHGPVGPSTTAPITAPITTTPSAPTGPQTITLPLSGNPPAVHIGGVIGAQLTIVLQGGGSFTYVNSLDHDTTAAGVGSTVQTPGWPMQQSGSPQPLPTLPWFVYTTPAAAGELDVLWTDASGGSHTTVVTYGP